MEFKIWREHGVAVPVPGQTDAGDGIQAQFYNYASFSLILYDSDQDQLLGAMLCPFRSSLLPQSRHERVPGWIVAVGFLSSLFPVPGLAGCSPSHSATKDTYLGCAAVFACEDCTRY